MSKVNACSVNGGCLRQEHLMLRRSLPFTLSGASSLVRYEELAQCEQTTEQLRRIGSEFGRPLIPCDLKILTLPFGTPTALVVVGVLL